MNWRMKSGLWALAACYCLGANAQVKEFPDFTKEGVIADYRLAMDILKKQHPNPYKFIDSTTLDRKVDSLLMLASKQTNSFACPQFSPIQLIRDVHTSISFSEDNTRDVISNIYFFPFPVIIEREKIFVNIKGNEIPYGAELVSINKQPVKEVVSSLSAADYSDGFINTGTDRMYGNFQLTLSMRNPYIKKYDIEYIDPKNKSVKKISMPSLAPSPGYHSTKQAVMPFNQLARSYWIFRNYNDETNTGTITVNTFNLQEGYAYKEFSAFFKEVNKRKYKNVIIDIRNNGGGNPAISALLYSFLSASPFRNEYNYRTKTIEIAYAEYAVAEGARRFSDEDIRSNKDFLYQRFNKDSATGFYVGNARLKEGQLENFPPDKNAFSGNVYVLAGGGTVSAATYFASLVQKNKRGEIIGKETGSGEQSTTAAWFLQYMLPKTKSILTVPMSELYFFNASTDSGKGVIPDKEIPLEKFVDYVRLNKDPELTYAYELIQSIGK